MQETEIKKRVAVLLLSHLHHIYHAAPIAFALSRLAGMEVTIFVSYEEAAQVLAEMESYYPDHQCTITIISESRWRKFTDFKRRNFPRPKNVLRHNMKQLLTFDAILTPDYFANFLIDNCKENRPRFIRAFHGAGDRAYGFRPDLKRYDLLLLSGRKFEARLAREGILDEVEYEIVGYPKFDIVANRTTAGSNLFENANPIVLYNPHFQGQFSSWPAWGIEILETFEKLQNYNLIFAPHIMLFGKLRTANVIPDKYFASPNMHIDLGSEALVDMSYSSVADIYLGDVSSQVYEFLIQPRPCIFLNAHNIDWRGDPNYRNWACGRVLDSVAELPSALSEARQAHENYLAVQNELIGETFSITEVPAGERAARAIAKHVTSGRWKNP